MKNVYHISDDALRELVLTDNLDKICWGKDSAKNKMEEHAEALRRFKLELSGPHLSIFRSAKPFLITNSAIEAVAFALVFGPIERI